MNIESCRCCQEDAPLLGGKLENIECAMQNADFAILCLSKPVLETACIRTRSYNKKFIDILVSTNKLSKSTLPLINSCFNFNLCSMNSW